MHSKFRRPKDNKAWVNDLDILARVGWGTYMGRVGSLHVMEGV
jgi:hypothetical protein